MNDPSPRDKPVPNERNREKVEERIRNGSTPNGPPRRRWRRLRRLALRIALGFGGMVMAYAIAMAVLSSIPLNGEAGRTGPIDIYVRSNGVHVDLILPVRNNRFDWTPVAPVEDVANPADAGAAPWIVVGCGDREFYRSVPSFRDLTPGFALGAGLGRHGFALHLVRQHAVEEGPSCRCLALTEAQYDALVAFILESGVPDANGRLVTVADMPGSGSLDAFYEAKRRYHVFFTCNTWSNLALKRSGLPCCVWTPIAAPILRHLPPPSPSGEMP